MYIDVALFHPSFPLSLFINANTSVCVYAMYLSVLLLVLDLPNPSKMKGREAEKINPLKSSRECGYFLTHLLGWKAKKKKKQNEEEGRKAIF